MRHIVLILLLVVQSTASGRQKTDVVRLLNGDHLTGEIKKLEHGKIQLSTDSLGTVNIEWEDIATVRSDYDFEFELTDGGRYYGSLEAGAEPSMLVVSQPQDMVMFAFTQVVRITPIEDSFADRINGSLSLGYNFTKASDVRTFSFNGEATYRTPDRAISLRLNSILTRDQDNVTTQRQDLQAAITRFRGNRRFNSMLTGVERNDELGLNNRLSVGGGLGRYLIQTNQSELSVLAGLIATRESLQGDVSSEENIEGLLRADYKRFIFDDPNVDISASLSIFPSATQEGRRRAQLDTRTRYEIVDDLFLDLSFYMTYDSDPPSGVDATTDYGIVTSLGWSF